MVMATVFISMLGETDVELNGLKTSVSQDKFKRIFRETYIRKKPKVLLWTTMFGSMSWFEEGKRDISNVCRYDCILTDDKREVQTADAVVYHLSDITWGGNIKNVFSFQFPSYRRRDQVWVLYNMEPITMVLGNYGSWQDVFNWTWSYSKNSDIHAPYGQYRNLSKAEISATVLQLKKTSTHGYDYFHNKSKSGGLAIISNCADDARRYRLIEKIRKFINVDVYGKCGKQCPQDWSSCENLRSSYQFYLAFENSDCRDYVTEKYWSTITRNQIPVVAWRYPMDGLVIPNSYINVYDFKDLDSAGAYIKMVGENRTLYNSYFEWKKTYRQIFKIGLCTLCEKLKDFTQPSQSYVDLYGWFASSLCRPVTVGIPQRAYDIYTTSHQPRCNVMTLHRRLCDVV